MPDILDLLDASAGSAGAVTVVPSDPDWVSWADVWRLAEHAGSAVQDRTGGGTVAAVLTPSVAAMATIAGCWRAGRTLVSLPQPALGADPDAYAAKIRDLCAAADVELLVTDGNLEPLAGHLEVPHATFAELADRRHTRRPLTPNGDRPILVQFTSGSTGTPKAIPLTGTQIGANVAAIAELLNPTAGGTGCSWLPLSHDMGLIGSLLVNWASAGMTGDHRLFYIDTARFLLRPSQWLQACSDVTATSTAAPCFALDLATRFLPRMRNLDLSSLRAVLVGAERVRARTLRDFAAAAGPFRFDEGALSPCYGLAEATLAVTITPPGQPWQSMLLDRSAAAAGELVPDGTGHGLELVGNGPALAGQHVAVTADGIGEITVDGPSVFDGYLGRARRAGPHRTGDLGTLAGGQLYVLGRLDDQLSVRGRNLAGTTVDALVEAHPDLRSGMAAVVETDDGFAVVVERPKRQSSSWAEPAADWIRNELARHVGIGPDQVLVVGPGTLPKTPSGKIQRSQLAALTGTDDLPVEAAHHYRTGAS